MDVRRAASAALTALVLTTTAGLVPLSAGAAEQKGVSTGDRAAAVVGSSRGNDPYFPFDGNGGYDVRHYLVDVSYVPGEDRLAGATRVRAVASRDLRAFHLDLALTPLRVSVDGRKARFSKPNRHELRVTPQRVLRAGQRFSVTVAYKGRPGSVRATGVSPFMAGREGLAVGQPQIGPWWFAANETPADKARFDIRLRVPAGQQALSNGELLGIDRGPRWTTWRWRMAAPMTTYLAFFAAGRFDVESGTVDGRSFHYGVSRHLSTAQQTRARAFLGRTPDVVSWMESQFGSYPFSSVGGVVVSRQIGFALETQTRPVYPYVGGPNDGAFPLLVHEVAHQWFGNHVAVKRWRDTWLNEGLATYIEWLYEEAHGGLTVEERLQEEYSVPSGDLFWDLRISDPGPEMMFDSAVYVRGGMMVAALRNRIGQADHEAFLRAWLQRYGGGNATGAQFRALAEEVSGEDLDGFFRAWLDDIWKPQRTAANGLG